MQAGTADLADGVEAVNGGAPGNVGAHAAAAVVRRRHDRNQVLGHVDAEFMKLCEDVRETAAQVVLALVADVEIGARLAGALEFVVNGAGHDVARGEAGHLMVPLHEFDKLAFAPDLEHGTLAADGFADEERLGLRVIEAGGMELEEFHVGNLGVGAVGHGDTIARGDIGVGRVEIDLAGAPGGEDGEAAEEGLDDIGRLVHDVGAEAAVLALPVRVACGDQVHGDVVFEDGDARILAAALEQDLGDLLAGDVAGVQDAAAGVPAFAPEVVGLGILVVRCLGDLAAAGEMQPQINQFLGTCGASGDDVAHDVFMAETGPGIERVGQVRVKRVTRLHDAGDAALGVAGVAFLGGTLGDNGDGTVFGGLDGGEQAGNAGTQNEEVRTVALEGGRVHVSMVPVLVVIKRANRRLTMGSRVIRVSAAEPEPTHFSEVRKDAKKKFGTK